MVLLILILEKSAFFYVTYIADNSVAVTSGYDQDYLHIKVIDLQTRKVKKTLKVNTINTGVAYSEEKFGRREYK